MPKPNSCVASLVSCVFLPRTVRFGLTTTVHPWFLTPTGRDQATSSRGRLYRKRKYCYFPVRSPALCIFQLHVIEVGRTVSLRDEGLPLTIFPDFPIFGYILWYAIVLCYMYGYGRTAGDMFS